MDKRYIVALEIGSSKIKGLAASVSDMGDISLIAVEEKKVNNCVRYGKIQNVQEVSAHVNEIIRKLENNLRIAPRKITDIFVGLGGRSLSTVTAQAHASFPNEIEITAETIERLKRDASFGLVTDKKTVEMRPHAFYVDNAEVKNVVGEVGTQIKAEFTAIVISPANQRNLELIKFENRNPKLHAIVRPTAIADLVLSPSERQLGCALVDFGAETTTISIYKDNVLQSIITLPIGSRNITRDLMAGLSMTEERAELAKAVNGSATTTDSPADADIEANNYIAARAGEIVANIMHQIDAAGFKAQSLAKGIILTGGGSLLRNFDKLVEAQAKTPVRIATIESSLQFKTGSFDRNSNIDILAIARQAVEQSDINCLDTPVVETEPDEKHEPETVNVSRTGGRREVEIDDDDLLGDDPDEDEVVKPGKKVSHVKGFTRGPRTVKGTHESNNWEEFTDEVVEIDDPTEEGDDVESSQGLVEKLKDKFFKFMNKTIDDEYDDLDEKID